MPALRLMTMNIWGVNGDWEARRAVLADGIAELDPDVLLLQETVRTPSFDQVRQLCPDGWAISHSQVRDRDGMGITLATRLPVRRVSEIDLQVNDRTADFPCTALLGELATDFGDLLVINYFPSWKLQLEAERLEQALHLTRSIEQLAPDPDQHVIIGGDLDADPDSGSIRLLTGRDAVAGTSVCFRDAWDSRHPHEPGHTYTPVENPLMVEDWPFRRIDYVLVRCAEHGGPTLDIVDCRRVFDSDRDGVWASDHFGLFAELAPRGT